MDGWMGLKSGYKYCLQQSKFSRRMFVNDIDYVISFLSVANCLDPEVIILSASLKYILISKVV